VKTQQHQPRFRASPCRALVYFGLGLASAALPACKRPDGPLTVGIITWDSVNSRIFMGGSSNWDVTPRVDELLDESAVFPHMVTARGLTASALSTMLTGGYPRDHGVRVNNQTLPTMTTLPERFQEVGYRTIGMSANQCHLLDMGVDVRVCTSQTELDSGSLRHRDQALVDSFLDELEDTGSRKHIFFWLHLNQAHVPYEMVLDWYDNFHPKVYKGSLLPASYEMLDAITLQGASYDLEDRYHLEAAYASQLREADRQVGRVIDGLREAERYDDAMLVFGFDHGEELAEHNHYFFHGCSPYNGVTKVLYAFRAPGRIALTGAYDGWVSTTDIAPTLVELADAFRWKGDLAGRSLVDVIDSGVEEELPAFFERGEETAGVVWKHQKYILSGETHYTDCKPYETEGGAFQTEPRELYDLVLDEDEQENMAGRAHWSEDILHDVLCDWVLESEWAIETDPAENKLIQACQAE